MSFVDTHVHFHFPDFDEDRSEAIGRAREAGVTRFINVGTDAASSQTCVGYAETYPDFYASAGIHPHDTKDADETALKAIEALTAHPKVVAIGEIGLDFFREHSPHETQKEVLRKFMAMYKRTGKPLIVHCRDAYPALLELLKQEAAPPYRGVMHCFSSDKATLKQFVDAGFHISFAGPLTYKKNDALREACKACPPDRLLLETDAPFLPPQSRRGKRNESVFILETARTAADLHRLSLEDLGRQTTANARKLFGLS